MKRLFSPTGEVADNAIKESDSDECVVRTAILVHSGENGEAIVFQSADGEIEFDEERIQRIVNNHNDYITGLAEAYGGLDKMPVGAYPPILDQHENDSNNRIVGRLACLLRFEKRDVPGVGKNAACVMADITFLGKETVERVKDGRIYHLSIGIDEATDTLGETSTVIQPAAPGAMLLKKKQKVLNQKEIRMSKRAEAHAKRMTKLKALKDGLATLTSKLATTKEQVTLAKKQGEVSGRLMKLMSAQKLTPAEFKKLDVKKLAKLSEESLTTVLESFEVREPVIHVGQRGTTSAVDFAKMGQGLEKKQMSKLKAEIKGDLKKLGAKLKGDDEKDEKSLEEKVEKKMAGPVEESVEPKKDPAAVSQLWAQMSKCLEDGDMAKCKEVHAAMGQHLSAEGEEVKMSGDMAEMGSEDYKKSMEGMQQQLDEHSTQMARMAGLLEEMMGDEEEEGQELSAEEKKPEVKEEKEEKNLAEDKKDDEDKSPFEKKLAEKEEEEKKKLEEKKEEENK